MGSTNVTNEQRVVQASREVIECADAIYKNADMVGLNLAELRQALAVLDNQGAPPHRCTEEGCWGQ
jgi:hypothetical protein